MIGRNGVRGESKSSNLEVLRRNAINDQIGHSGQNEVPRSLDPLPPGDFRVPGEIFNGVTDSFQMLDAGGVGIATNELDGVFQIASRGRARRRSPFMRVDRRGRPVRRRYASGNFGCQSLASKSFS